MAVFAPRVTARMAVVTSANVGCLRKARSGPGVQSLADPPPKS